MAGFTPKSLSASPLHPNSSCCTICQTIIWLWIARPFTHIIVCIWWPKHPKCGQDPHFLNKTRLLFFPEKTQKSEATTNQANLSFFEHLLKIVGYIISIFTLFQKILKFKCEVLNWEITRITIFLPYVWQCSVSGAVYLRESNKYTLLHFHHSTSKSKT